MKHTPNPKIVIIGGGVGSSTFTTALKDLPIKLATIVSSFDDGGSTGSMRRDYGGIALGDLRQCLLASLSLDEHILSTLNHRYGSGALYGVNIGNVLLRSFLDAANSEREGLRKLHKIFGLGNQVLPISYTFARLQAQLHNKQILRDQEQIAKYLDFSKSAIKKLSLSKRAIINPDARRAIVEADYIFLAPGHFFTSLLPHLYVDGFSAAWKKSKAKKVWFLNLLAHKGQDSFYDFFDYLAWFEDQLGKKPFDMIVVNKQIAKKLVREVDHRFAPVRFDSKHHARLSKVGVNVQYADLVLPTVRKQQANDSVLRAPLRHDVSKIRAFVTKLLSASA